MQKRLLQFGMSIILVSGLTLGFTSCVKNYVCKCEVSYEGKPGLPNSFSKEYEIKDTNKNAKKLCQDASKTITEMGITTKEVCDLY
jgi:hypothetical protein